MNVFNPYEWGGRYKLGLTDSKQANTFNLLGSMWFILTSLQWQGKLISMPITPISPQ